MRRMIEKIVFLFVAMIVSPTLIMAQRYEQNLNDDWRFIDRDVEDGMSLSCDDSKWKSIDLPFDYSAEGDYSRDNTPQNAYLPVCTGIFRKTINYNPQWKNKRQMLWFDGAYMDSDVYVNGQFVGNRPYGFISFTYDITDYLIKGENIIAIRIRNDEPPTSRFYHGSSVYGDTKLISVSDVHIPVMGGLFYRVEKCEDNKASIIIETEVKNQGDDSGLYKVEYAIVDNQKRVVADFVATHKVGAGSLDTLINKIEIDNPMLWSTETPYLYTLEARLVKVDGKKDVVVDNTSTKLGVRTIRYDAQEGLFLNGVHTKLKGVCEHMEMLPVGQAIPKDLWRKRIQNIKDMGCNAIRTAHNPFTPVFYQLCDEMGMLVVDEIFDGWHKKGANDYGGRFFAEWWQTDVEEWIRRDRNHPSIIMWSIGNETGSKDKNNITAEIHKHDRDTRPTSAGNVMFDVDISGFTGHGGQPGTLEKFHRDHPNNAIVLMEVPHTIQTRGFYRVPTWWRDKSTTINEFEPYGTKQIFFDGYPQRYRSSYDNCGVRINARTCWKRTKNTPWIIGEFRWTGYDCLGEAQFMGPEFPKRSYNAGVIDFAGFHKDLYYFYQSQWTREPMVHILPHWTHHDLAVGTIIPVVGYSNCDEVELFLNGKSQGRKAPGELLDFVWDVAYASGELKAIGYINGRKVAYKVVETASYPEKLNLKLEQQYSKIADSMVHYLDFSSVDKNGVFVPWCDNNVSIKIEGETKFLGMENGAPLDSTANVSHKRRMFYGLLRSFTQNTTAKNSVKVYAGAVLAKTLFKKETSVAIDFQAVALRGELKDQTYTIRFTTDGTEPTSSSDIYTKPFMINETTRVRATIYHKNTSVLTLDELLTKGEVEAYVDPHLQTDDVLKGRFVGPFDSEIIGLWEVEGVVYYLAPQGAVIINKSNGNPTKIGEWWYDYPNDKFESPDAVGAGEIKFYDDDFKSALKLEKGDDNTLHMINQNGDITMKKK